MRRTITALLPIAVGILLVTSGRPAAQSAPPPAAAGGATDPGFDWERPPDPRARHDHNWAKTLTFKSTRTLEQTSRWLQSAIERYGDGRAQITTFDVSDVRFRQCTMDWTEQRVMSGVTTISKYSVPLSHVDLRMKTIQASSQDVRFGLTKESPVLRRYLEHGRDKGSRTEPTRDILIYVRDEDRISNRIAWALIHASRLCGAQVQTEYGSGR
jgi:hypothetical protein